ncbi:MAG: hypothetical protein KYX62_05000 [Pseudomonadota bacterium]|nr:hypothetical protein [Pseudomonadota bacterium]
MTGSHGYKKILGPEDDRSLTRNVWVPECQYNEWKRIKDGRDGNYYMTSLFRSITDMAKTPGARMPMYQMGRYGDFDMSYQISPASKDIYLNLVALSNSSESIGPQTPGLYRTYWEGDATDGRWKVKESCTTMELSHQWGGAHSAVIPGKFESKEVAGRLIAEHLENAYYPQTRQKNAIHKNNNHFSMFWLNDEFTSDAHVKSLVSMMQIARKQSAELQWLVHGEACGTFVRAAEYLKKNPISDNPHEAQKGFALQSFYFSNPRGRRTSKSDLEKICKDVGFTYEDTHINKHDVFRNSDARKDAVWGSLKKLSGISLAVLGGSAGLNSTMANDLIGVDTVMKIKDLVDSPLGLATGVAVAAGIVVLADKGASLYGYGRNLGGVASSTFGNGNQNWAA